jgi:hypothetical protein
VEAQAAQAIIQARAEPREHKEQDQSSESLPLLAADSVELTIMMEITPMAATVEAVAAELTEILELPSKEMEQAVKVLMAEMEL